MSKNSNRKSKNKQKKRKVQIEHEYKGDISNFEEFANFYRQRDAFLKCVYTKKPVLPKKSIKRKKDLSFIKNQENLSLMKCNEEFNFYYNKILQLSKKEKSPLDVLSELAYLDFYKDKIITEDCNETRDCVIGHQNCAKKECWVENCKKCTENTCASCSSDRITKINEYFNNTQVRKDDEPPSTNE